MIHVNEVELEDGKVYLSVALSLEDINDMLSTDCTNAIKCLGENMLNILEDNSEVQTILKNLS